VFETKLRRTLKTGCICAIAFVLGGNAWCTSASRPAAACVVTWQPARPVNGSAILFQVNSGARLESLSGKWMDRDVFFLSDASGKKWFGIAGVGIETHPGAYSLTLNGKSAPGTPLSLHRQITIGKGKYPQISVNVPKQFTEPNPEQLQQIKEEQTLKHDVFSRINPTREWTGDFAAPVQAAISDVFGTARVFNGSTQSVHQGLDYAVPSGTPVDALNRGVVVLARALFFEGNCVVLDHGQGLLSIYMHLSKIEVNEGDTVNRGQEIALSGGTGRATGPHLHVAARWQGIYVDPASLLRLQIP
jgi:murein DD-endopeptidase MepM/ murein hydrolase activator NlpD